jgi:hypothetical protein
MSPSTPPPDPSFENIDRAIDALGEPGTTEEDRRLFLRVSVRCLEVIAGNLQVRLGAIADALTPPRTR